MRSKDEDLTGLSDAELIELVVGAGLPLLESSRHRLANLGDVPDDDRWEAPFPLRFDAQVAYPFLGGLDAFDVSLGVLGRRASQQAFNTMRFQLETLALIRWLAEPPGAAERQRRAYKVVAAELRRFEEFMVEDAGGDPGPFADVAHIKRWRQQLRTIASEYGVDNLKGPPARRELLSRHGETSGYPTWRMLSELGSHPPAPGHTLLLIEPDGPIVYDLDRPSVARAFFAATAIFYAWRTSEAVAKALGWGRWVAEEVAPIFRSAAGPMLEATGGRTYGASRRQAADPRSPIARGPALAPRCTTKGAETTGTDGSINGQVRS